MTHIIILKFTWYDLFFYKLRLNIFVWAISSSLLPCIECPHKAGFVTLHSEYGPFSERQYRRGACYRIYKTKKQQRQNIDKTYFGKSFFFKPKLILNSFEPYERRIN